MASRDKLRVITAIPSVSDHSPVNSPSNEIAPTRGMKASATMNNTAKSSTGENSITAPPGKVALKPTENEKAGLTERRWWSVDELGQTTDKLLPASLPRLVEDLSTGTFNATPLNLSD